MDAFARKMNDTPKVVFSRSLTDSRWEGATLARNTEVEEIERLKEAPAGDIIAYGGATFVSELIRYRLIDEVADPVEARHRRGSHSRDGVYMSPEVGAECDRTICSVDPQAIVAPLERPERLQDVHIAGAGGPVLTELRCRLEPSPIRWHDSPFMGAPSSQRTAGYVPTS